METNTCEKPARSHSRLSLPDCNQSKSGHGNKEPKPKILRYQEFSLDLNAELFPFKRYLLQSVQSVQSMSGKSSKLRDSII